jgi:hypothetical protein
METKYVADSLMGHLSAGKTAVACIALGFGDVVRGEEREEMLRECREHLSEDGSILIPWRPGILIACWGQIGELSCALRSAARSLHSLRERQKFTKRGVTVRMSLDTCDPHESPLSYRKAFSQIVRDALVMTLSSPAGTGAWFASQETVALLESQFSIRNLEGSKTWKEILGKKELPLSPMPFEWIQDPSTKHSEGSILNPRGTRELSLAECATVEPIVLLRPKWSAK